MLEFHLLEHTKFDKINTPPAQHSRYLAMPVNHLIQLIDRYFYFFSAPQLRGSGN